MPKKDKKSKTVVVKKTSKKGKLSQSQSITVNIQKGKSSAKQPSGKPTIASSIASLANVIRTSDFYRPSETPTPVAPVGAVRAPIKASVATQVSEPMKKSIAIQSEPEPFRLGSGRFNLPSRQPVNLKLPPQSFPARQDIQKEEDNFQKLIKAEKLAKDVESKYGQPADTYGHSLGSYRSEKANTGGKIYTYNRAVGFKDIGKKLPDRHTDIRTSKDVVSLLSLTQRGGTRKTISSPLTSTVIGSHSISQLGNKPEQSTLQTIKNKASSIASKVIPKLSFR